MRRDTLAARLGEIPLGFRPEPSLIAAFLESVRDLGEFRPRPALEEDPTFLQLIVQGLVTKGGSVLALHRRSRESCEDRFVETRHNGLVALTAGGHVEQGEGSDADDLRSALFRELSEELVFAHPPHPRAVRPLGIICNGGPDAPLFHRVHIGLVFHVPVSRGVSLPPTSDEFEALEFAAPQRLRELFPRLEGWGQLLTEVITAGALRLSV